MDNSSNKVSYSEPLKILVQGKDITDKFICLICTELPKGPIYQCKDGHFFCEQCYDNPLVKVCPCCRCKLPSGSNRIRNLLGEKCLDEVLQVECPFKVNGCGKRLRRNFVEAHSALCSYNLQKFGNFVNLCKKIGHPDCNFEINNGTTARAIQHFQTEHGFKLAKQSEKYQMELVDFNKSAIVNLPSAPHFWTPIIAKLPAEGNGHVLLVPIINKTKDLACLSIWLPDSSSYNSPSTTAPPIQVEYAVKTKDCSKLVFYQTLMSIAKTTGLELIPSSVKAVVLKEYMHEKENLKIDIKMILRASSSDFLKGSSTVETLYCKINPPVETDDDANAGKKGATEKAKKWLDEEEAKSKLDREHLWKFLFTLFNRPGKPDGYSYDEVVYVKKEFLLLVLRNGTTAQLKFLKNKGSYLSYMLEGANVAALEYVLKKDADKTIGLEKIKFLINSGVNFKSLNSSNQSLLHHACRYGTVQTVKYVLNELKLDVSALDENGMAPLVYADQNADYECALQIKELLLLHEAELLMNE